jgi:hypothetical protein
MLKNLRDGQIADNPAMLPIPLLFFLAVFFLAVSLKFDHRERYFAIVIDQMRVDEKGTEFARLNHI